MIRLSQYESEEARQRFISALPEAEDIFFIAMHGNPTTHWVQGNDPDNWKTRIYVKEVAEAMPKKTLTILYSCSTARFTEPGYIAGAYIFSGEGLVSLGSTRVGGVWPDDAFFASLKDMSIGSSFANWYSSMILDDPNRLGFTLLGDPTLHLYSSCGDGLRSGGELCDRQKEGPDACIDGLQKICNDKCEGYEELIVEDYGVCCYQEGKGSQSCDGLQPGDICGSGSICNTGCECAEPICGDSILSPGEVCDHSIAKEGMGFGYYCDGGLKHYCDMGCDSYSFSVCSEDCGGDPDCSGRNDGDLCVIGSICQGCRCTKVSDVCGNGVVEAGEECEPDLRPDSVCPGCSRACIGTWLSECRDDCHYEIYRADKSDFPHLTQERKDSLENLGAFCTHLCDPDPESMLCDLKYVGGVCSFNAICDDACECVPI